MEVNLTQLYYEPNYSMIFASKRCFESGTDLIFFVNLGIARTMEITPTAASSETFTFLRATVRSTGVDSAARTPNPPLPSSSFPLHSLSLVLIIPLIYIRQTHLRTCTRTIYYHKTTRRLTAETLT